MRRHQDRRDVLDLERAGLNRLPEALEHRCQRLRRKNGLPPVAGLVQSHHESVPDQRRRHLALDGSNVLQPRGGGAHRLRGLHLWQSGRRRRRRGRRLNELGHAPRLLRAHHRRRRQHEDHEHQDVNTLHISTAACHEH